MIISLWRHDVACAMGPGGLCAIVRCCNRNKTVEPEHVVVAQPAEPDASPPSYNRATAVQPSQNIPGAMPHSADDASGGHSYGEMTAKELRLVATGKGVSDDAIEIARDAHDPRAELIALIQAHENTPDPAPIDYGSMTVGELREMASKAGIAHEAIEDARDGDDPRAELIALITTQSEQGLGP